MVSKLFVEEVSQTLQQTRKENDLSCDWRFKAQRRTSLSETKCHFHINYFQLFAYWVILQSTTQNLIRVMPIQINAN